MNAKRHQTKHKNKRSAKRRERLKRGKRFSFAAKNRRRAPIKPLTLPTILLTVGGLGFLRPAPGTWGTAPPAILAFAMLLAGASAQTLTITMLIVAIIFSAICVVWGKYSEQRFGRKDAAEVVADETAAAALPFAFLPHQAIEKASLTAGVGADHTISAVTTAALIAATGFFMFRAFDVLKIQPAKSLEALPHGWGVLCDDLMSGVYAWVATFALISLLLV